MRKACAVRCQIKTVVVNCAIISSFESVKKSGALKYYKLITVSLITYNLLRKHFNYWAVISNFLHVEINFHVFLAQSGQMEFPI